MDEDLKREYNELVARMQTGVAFSDGRAWAEAGIPDKIANELKHLRVGINSGFVAVAGLVTLLTEKGLITQSEYLLCQVVAMREEVARMEGELSRHYKTPITLAPAGTI